MTLLIFIAHSSKAIITPGIISIYRQMIEYTMSDLNEAKQSFGGLFLSAIDKEVFLRICRDSWNSSNSLQLRTIEAVRETLGTGMMQANKMAFCTSEEAFGNLSN